MTDLGVCFTFNSDPPGKNISQVGMCIIQYYGLFLCNIQVSVIKMEINQAIGDQLA